MNGNNGRGRFELASKLAFLKRNEKIKILKGFLQRRLKLADVREPFYTVKVGLNQDTKFILDEREVNQNEFSETLNRFHPFRTRVCPARYG